MNDWLWAFIIVGTYAGAGGLVAIYFLYIDPEP